MKSKKIALPVEVFNDISLALVKMADGMPDDPCSGICQNIGDVVERWMGHFITSVDYAVWDTLDDLCYDNCEDWARSFFGSIPLYFSRLFPVNGRHQFDNDNNSGTLWQGESLMRRKSLATFLLKVFLKKYTWKIN